MTEPKSKIKSTTKLVNFSVLEKKIATLNVRTNIIIKAKGQSMDYIKKTVEQLDKLIIELAKRTLISNDDNHIVNKLKEQVWTLLEKLEQYCLTNLDTSIW